jgi:hypothetical protein
MKKVLSLLLFTVVAFVCKAQTNPKVWTPKYERGLYNYLDSTMKITMADPQKRVEFISFFIMRAKQEIPNGLKSVSKDSLQNLNIRIGREYAFKLHEAGNPDLGLRRYYEAWTPKIDKTFRDTYATLFKEKGQKNSDRFCDCIIEKLKAIYPDSLLVPVPNDIMIKATLDCKKVVDVNR